MRQAHLHLRILGGAGICLLLHSIGPSVAYAQAGSETATKARAGKAERTAVQGTPAPTTKAQPAAGADKGSSQALLALVNDEPISAYDVDQRINLMLLSSGDVNERLRAKLREPGINERFKQYVLARIPNPTSREQVMALQKDFVESIRRQTLAEARPSQRKAALEEIIDERLKLQAAKRAGIAVSEADVSAAINEIAKKNNKTEKEFAAMLAGMGVNIETMRARFRSGIAWRDVVRRQYGHQISIGTRDIEKALASTAGGPNAGTETELQLHRIVLAFAPKSDEKTKTARFAEADQLRRKFAGCKSTAALVQGVQGAKFEDLGARAAASVGEPTRSVLLAAKVGEMAPPSLAAGGVELYALCGRNEKSSTEAKREEATRELQAQEFELLAKRYLKDLRQDAVIEYR